MPWVKLDDSFYDHPKFVGLSPAAGWLWVRMLAWCNHHRTDGFIPNAVVGSGGKAQAAALVAARLWEREIGGYRVHDYLEYQPASGSDEDRESKRHARNVAGGRARARLAQRDAGRFVPPA